MVAHVGPNWFSAVMGTGIVAVAAASLPIQPPGLRGAATAVWALAAVLLVVLVVATAAHRVAHPLAARGHASDPAMAPSYGAVPMAFLTVGAGTLLLGGDVVGTRVAVDVDWALWTVGSLLGLVTTVVIPLTTFAHPGRRTPTQATAWRPSASWLLPVVPPVVSATTGALLLPHAAAGAARLTMLVVCTTLLGVGLTATAAILPAVLRELVRSRGTGGHAPAVWIVLGPLGQSATAACLLGAAAAGVVGAPGGRALQEIGVGYALVVWGVAMLWLAVAATLTVRQHRDPTRGMPFALSWWAFTFPVGTCVTASSQLWLHTGGEMFRVAAVALYGLLMAAWVTVGARTLHGAWTGRLLAPT